MDISYVDDVSVIPSNYTPDGKKDMIMYNRNNPVPPTVLLATKSKKIGDEGH